VEHSIKSGLRVGVESPPTGSSPEAMGNCNENILKLVFEGRATENLQTVRDEDIIFVGVCKNLSPRLCCA